LRIDPSSNLDVIASEVGNALRDARESEDRQAVDSLFDKAIGSGKAVAGAEAVAGAVGAGKVHVLYLDTKFREPGWKCFQCGALGLKTSLGCPVCNSALEAVELGEEMVRGTLAADGRAFSLSGHPALRAEGGAAALLRYS
jgi:peptide subunit release factor 1 (eRF1)